MVENRIEILLGGFLESDFLGNENTVDIRPYSGASESAALGDRQPVGRDIDLAVLVQLLHKLQRAVDQKTGVGKIMDVGIVERRAVGDPLSPIASKNFSNRSEVRRPLLSSPRSIAFLI